MTDNTFEPRIYRLPVQLVYLHRRRPGGHQRLQYPPNVRIIRLMCSGAVDPIYVLKADLAGADGILIGGCHPGIAITRKAITRHDGVLWRLRKSLKTPASTKNAFGYAGSAPVRAHYLPKLSET